MSRFLPYEGLVAAVHTPFEADAFGFGSVRLESVPVQARYLAATGVVAVFVAGTTGEGSSLTGAEKRQLFEAWAQHGPNAGLRVIAHVGGNAPVESVELAAFVERLAGIEAIGVIAPSFLKPASPDALAKTVGAIAAAAPSKAAYYYDIPVLTGIPFDAPSLCTAFAHHAPTLRGIKCTRYEAGAVLEYRRAMEGGYDVLFGRDEALLTALALGVRGAVGSTYNYAAPLYVDLIDAFDRGDLERARELQLQSVDLIEAIARFDYLPACRVLMDHLGVAMGPPRLPLAALSGEASARLIAAVEAHPFNLPTAESL